MFTFLAKRWQYFTRILQQIDHQSSLYETMSIRRRKLQNDLKANPQ